MNYNSQKNILSKNLHNEVRIIDILSESKLQLIKPKSIFNKFRLKNNKILPTIIHHKKHNTLTLNPNPFFEYDRKINNKKKINLILEEYDDSTTIPTIQNTQTINSINHIGKKLKKNSSNLTSLSISPFKFKNNKLKKDFSTINTDYKIDKKIKKKKLSKYEFNTEILKRKLKLGDIKIKKAFINVKTAEKNISNEYMKIKLQLNNQFKKLFQKNNNNKKDFK
jgi:hypothetical protein